MKEVNKFKFVNRKNKKETYVCEGYGVTEDKKAGKYKILDENGFLLETIGMNKYKILK